MANGLQLQSSEACMPEMCGFSSASSMFTCLAQVVDSLKKGYQAMIFVHSRKDTGKTARALAVKAQNAGDMALGSTALSIHNTDSYRRMSRSPGTGDVHHVPMSAFPASADCLKGMVHEGKLVMHTCPDPVSMAICHLAGICLLIVDRDLTM